MSTAPSEATCRYTATATARGNCPASAQEPRRKPALVARAIGTIREGPSALITRAPRGMIARETTAEIMSIEGSALMPKLLRNSASRVALPPTCPAMSGVEQMAASSAASEAERGAITSSGSSDGIGSSVPRPQRIGPVPPSTPTGPGRAWPFRHVLPEDLLREASHRLSTIALLGAVLWIVGVGLDHLVQGLFLGDPAGLRPRASDLIGAVSVVLSLALFFYARRSDRDPRFILDLGLVYLVVSAFALGNMFHWAPMPHHKSVAPMISWVGVCCLMFAAIVPSTPGKTLIAGLLAASMNPLGMLIARARGMWDFGPTSNLLLMHYPDYVMVGIAVVISVVVTRLGQQVIRAREMGSYRLGELLGKGGMGEVY